MALLPSNQRDQLKLLLGIAAIGGAAWYYMYPYAAKTLELDTQTERVVGLEDLNARYARQFATGSLETVRIEAAKTRSAMIVMRRLVPTANEVPALLEEVSTAARRAGLDVGGVTPQPVIAGSHFDTHRYAITILGQYHEIGAFLANVGSLARIVAPVNLSLAPGTAGQRTGVRAATTDQLVATILLQTYVERTQPAPAPESKS
ncbi:MAG: hypothetical protein RLZZ621_1236 [Gemmatimonadota bacterium]|jgi:type IV pilus assembly protein PilO